MIRSAALAQVGLLDEDYWLYTEETDWCYRARQMGWDILVRPDAFFTHVEQASSAQRLGKSFVNFADSRVLFARKTQDALRQGSSGRFRGPVFGLVHLPGRSHLGRPEAGYSEPEVRAAYKTYLQTSLGRFLGRS